MAMSPTCFCQFPLPVIRQYRRTAGKFYSCDFRPRDSPGISVRNVSLTWPGGHCALNNVSLDVQPGEFCMLVGANGSGKSTLLDAVRGMVSVDEGQIHLEKPVSYIQQDPDLQIVFPTIGLDVTFSIPKRHEIPRDEVRQMVLDQLDAVGLYPAEDFYDLASCRLSGGQKQRAVLAAALISQPRVVLFDEVTAPIDPLARAGLLDLVRNIVSEQKLSALWYVALLYITTFCSRKFLKSILRRLAEVSHMTLWPHPRFTAQIECEIDLCCHRVAETPVRPQVLGVNSWRIHIFFIFPTNTSARLLTALPHDRI